MFSQNSSRLAAITLALVCLHGSRLRAGELEQFLQGISSDNKDVRYEARLSAGEHGAPAVAPLVTLMAEGRREVSISALRALEILVHYAGHPDRVDESRTVGAALAAHLTGVRAQGGVEPVDIERHVDVLGQRLEGRRAQ